MAKQRVQKDAFVIGAFMIIVGILVLKFPGMYGESKNVRDVLSVVGFVLIIFGALFRMAARGYKRESSRQGHELVADGPYAFVRNPMYLGTFLIAVGFMCPLYPVWAIVSFAAVFYARFIIQIRKEEAWLGEHFGEAYRGYCRLVPPFFPTLRNLRTIDLNEIFPSDHLWLTKEKYNLFYWPVLSVVLTLLKEQYL